MLQQRTITINPLTLQWAQELARTWMNTATVTLIVLGFAAAQLALADDDASTASNAVKQPLPEIGTKMPDGTVYAGLSIDSGKPQFVPEAGGRMSDGTVYAGISPESNQALYTTPEDAAVPLSWSKAARYCKSLSAFGHRDWRVPTLGELAVLYNNRADIGGFNETGFIQNAPGYYWSSQQVGDGFAWGQRFNDGYHDDFSKDRNSLLRCVR